MLRNGTNAERMFLSFGCCASSRVRCGWSAEVEAVQLLTRGLPEIALMCGAIQQGKVCWQNGDADIGTLAWQPDFCSSPLVYTASRPQANSMCCQVGHNLTQMLRCAKAVDTTSATPVHRHEMENLTLQPMLATQNFFLWTPKARCLP